MYLTNFAVNRNSNVEVKQGLEWFWNWYENEQLGSREEPWQKIHNIVAKTLLPISSPGIGTEHACIERDGNWLL